MQTYIPKRVHIRDHMSLDAYIASLPRPPVIRDYFSELLKELFLSSSPKHYYSDEMGQQIAFAKHLASLQKNTDISTLGAWIYHPWNNTLYHILDKKEYYMLRTIRHRDIITQDEQTRLEKSTIAIAGLSVGLNILLSFVRFGIGTAYHIADVDVVSLSNSNRALYTLHDLGKPKCEVARDRIHELDPFLNVHVWQNGVTENTLTPFLRGTNLIIDAFDRFDMKLALRKEAKKRKIPVISGFDVEKGVLVITERYDIDPTLSLDHFLNSTPESSLQKMGMTAEERTSMFVNIIGKKHHSNRMLHSVMNVGKTLTGYPQLIIATLAAASLFTLCAEDILLGRNTASTRVFIPLPSLIHS